MTRTSIRYNTVGGNQELDSAGDERLSAYILCGAGGVSGSAFTVPLHVRIFRVSAPRWLLGDRDSFRKRLRKFRANILKMIAPRPDDGI
ncbi:hypothetical protein EVAR_44563_1 [Eumeta japonica]|uniref:Uncharacterized protein n=1 Tax=Eumeta variegata TaxID=151549 RepID=A0A4C1XC40_EUMVA|nr:hypothetical protein EVAR_44563_1 [Eumeta japonica]